jgi:hypothetical protein
MTAALDRPIALETLIIPPAALAAAGLALRIMERLTPA